MSRDAPIDCLHVECDNVSVAAESSPFNSPVWISLFSYYFSFVQKLGGCGAVFCFLCLAPYWDLFVHGNHFHRPQCDFYNMHGLLCCQAKCIENGAVNCIDDRFKPGPCAACKDSPTHNTCTHQQQWQACR